MSKYSEFITIDEPIKLPGGFKAFFRRSSAADTWECRLSDNDFKDTYYLGTGETPFDALRNAHTTLMKDRQK